MKVLNLDTDGSVKRQGLERYFRLDTVELSDLSNNLRFYADRYGIRECSRRLTPYSGEGVFSLLGSGDFHHLTLLTLEKLTKPFHLVVFDNHTDCSFMVPKYHCGNWMYHASRLPLCRRVTHIGSNDFSGIWNRLGIRPLEKEGRLSLLPGAKSHGNDAFERFKNLFGGAGSGLPVYVSVDKDVLNEKEAPGDWDNGTMSTESLTKMLEWIQKNFVIIGCDMAGEMGGKFNYRNKPVKNLFSLVEHRQRGSEKKFDEADSKHLLINIEILETLGAAHVAS